MKNEIQIFKNPQFGGIRVITDKENEPVFCLFDVAKALGYSKPSKAVIDHCKGVTVLETPTAGGVQSMKFGKESEVYRLVMRSKLPDAEKFQDWVCEEVLPSIRKHGGYLTPSKIEEVLTNPDTIILLAQNLKQEQQKRIEAEKLIEINKPKVLFADAVSASKTSILVGELAKIIKQNGVDMGQNRLFEWLRVKGFLISRKGTDYNMPTQRSMEMGLFEIKETSISHSDGHISVNKTPKVTGKGQTYFINKLIGCREAV